MENITEESVVMEAPLTDTLVYRSFNNNAAMTQIIISAIKDSIVIDKSYVEEQLLQIQRTRISPLSDDVLRAFETGEVTLLYSKIKKVPQMLPFFVTKMQGKLKAFVFVNNHGTISASAEDKSRKYLNITMKDMYVLMEGAYTALQYAIYPTNITKSMALMKVSSSIYTQMVVRILNKEKSIANDQDIYNKVVFCVSKFFLERVWMANNSDVVFTYSKNNIHTAVNVAELMVVDKLYQEANVVTFSDLLNFLSTLSPRLKDLSFRYFIQCYINMYKPPAIFGLECLPYFLFTIETSLIGSFIVNAPIITDITKNTKGMNSFYPELVKVLS